MSKDELISAAKIILWMLLTCAVMSMCSSCSSTKYVPMPSTSVKTEYVYRTDTVYKDRVKTVLKETERHDTIHVKDSTRVIVDVAGNVVRTDRFREERQLAHDNTYVSQFDSLVAAFSKVLQESYASTDSIAVPYPVEKKPGFFDRMENIVFSIFILIIGIIGVIKVKRFVS